MSDRRFEQGYDLSPLPYKVKIAIADALEHETWHPERIAKSLESHANAVRDEMDDPERQFKIEPKDHDRLQWAVYDETGNEYLFGELDGVLAFVGDELGDGS